MIMNVCLYAALLGNRHECRSIANNINLSIIYTLIIMAFPVIHQKPCIKERTKDDVRV